MIACPQASVPTLSYRASPRAGKKAGDFRARKPGEFNSIALTREGPLKTRPWTRAGAIPSYRDGMGKATETLEATAQIARNMKENQGHEGEAEMSRNDAGQVVSDFCAAISTLDMRKAVAHLTEDVVFDNVPQPPAVRITSGREAVREGMQTLLDACEFAEFEILEQVEQGETVMNERVDRFRFKPGTFPGGDLLEWPVATLWKVRDGRIALWRDYYDLNLTESQLGVSLAEFGQIIGRSYTGD